MCLRKQMLYLKKIFKHDRKNCFTERGVNPSKQQQTSLYTISDLKTDEILVPSHSVNL